MSLNLVFGPKTVSKWNKKYMEFYMESKIGVAIGNLKVITSFNMKMTSQSYVLDK